MQEKQKKPTILNVPNVLTIIRMALIPVYWVLFMQQQKIAALCVYAAASLTDLLDGYIAREHHLITDFGKLMDPLADKLMVVSVMLSLAMTRVIPWAALIILAVKEGLMVLGGLFMLGKGRVVYSRWIGKAAQTVVVSSLILSFFDDFWHRVGVPVHLIALWLGIALTLCALVFYAVNAYKSLQETNGREEKAENTKKN